MTVSRTVVSRRRALTGSLCAAALILGLAPAGRAAEVTVSADLASAYVFRGVTFNDEVALQPGVEVEGLPVTFGVWANFDVTGAGASPSEAEFSEIDINVSYGVPIEMVDLSVGYTEYTYPSAGGDADRELSVSCGFNLPFDPSVSIYYGVDGLIEKSFYAEVGAGYEYACDNGIGLSVEGLVAFLAPDGGDSGFSHCSATLGASYGPLSASLTYVAQIDDEVLPDGAYDVELYGTVGASHSF